MYRNSCKSIIHYLKTKRNSLHTINPITQFKVSHSDCFKDYNPRKQILVLAYKVDA